MRGADEKQEAMFSYLSPEKRVPTDHPLRPIREMVDGVLKEMSPRFGRLYAQVGRPSIAPERLLRALLLQIFYSIRSERLLMEQLNYNLLFRWFVGMEMDEVVWHHAVFSKNRERLLNEAIAEAFFQRVLAIAQPYLSDEHFTVDGTLIEAWASHKSFRPKDEQPSGGEGSGEVNFHGGAPLQRHASVHHRSRGATVQEVERPRGQAQLPGSRADGKSPRVVGKDARDAGRRERRTGRSAGDGGESGGPQAPHLGRRQELRHARLRARFAATADHAARSAKHHEPLQCD